MLGIIFHAYTNEHMHAASGVVALDGVWGAYYLLVACLHLFVSDHLFRSILPREHADE